MPINKLRSAAIMRPIIEKRSEFVRAQHLKFAVLPFSQRGASYGSADAPGSLVQFLKALEASGERLPRPRARVRAS